jgi:hypothetical protein
VAIFFAAIFAAAFFFFISLYLEDEGIEHYGWDVESLSSMATAR